MPSLCCQGKIYQSGQCLAFEQVWKVIVRRLQNVPLNVLREIEKDAVAEAAAAVLKASPMRRLPTCIAIAMFSNVHKHKSSYYKSIYV